jgi:hypothetical protein
MAAKRVTQHSGRKNRSTGIVYNPKHNDRSFDAPADNIDATRTPSNIYYTWNGAADFTQSERDFFTQTYQASLDNTNAKYKKEGHLDRIKTMDDWLKDSKKAPEEVILQIGSVDDGYPDNETFTSCVKEYIQELEKFSSNMTVLDYAMHFDEAVPHAHIRRVWHYADKDGLVKPGQNQALDKLGIPLPDPNKAKSRTNNRKVSFDKLMREKWIDICKKYGLNIISDPIPDAKHNQSKEQMVRTKYQNIIKATEQAEKECAETHEKAQEWLETVSECKSTVEGLERQEKAIKSVLEHTNHQATSAKE